MERYYLIFWPEESCYSEVAQAKIIEPKEPSVGDIARVKECTKIHTGKVVGFGSKGEVEKLMMEFDALDNDGGKEQEEAVVQRQGTVHA